MPMHMNLTSSWARHPLLRPSPPGNPRPICLARPLRHQPRSSPIVQQGPFPLPASALCSRPIRIRPPPPRLLDPGSPGRGRRKRSSMRSTPLHRRSKTSRRWQLELQGLRCSCQRITRIRISLTHNWLNACDTAWAIPKTAIAFARRAKGTISGMYSSGTGVRAHE